MTKEELAKRVAELSRPACAIDPTETCRCSGNVLRIVADERDAALAALREEEKKTYAAMRATHDARLQRDRALDLLRRWTESSVTPSSELDVTSRALLAEVGWTTPDIPGCDWEGCDADIAKGGDYCPAHECNCNPEDQTGGGHHRTCPQFDPMHGAEPVQW